jgi:hypothetical protein
MIVSHYNYLTVGRSTRYFVVSGVSARSLNELECINISGLVMSPGGIKDALAVPCMNLILKAQYNLPFLQIICHVDARALHKIIIAEHVFLPSTRLGQKRREPKIV